MATFVSVAKTGDVPPGAVIEVQCDGQPVALANVNGEYLAIGGTCTHRGGPLGEGELDGETIVCPWHGGMFSVRTGDVEMGPPSKPVPAYRVLVEGDDIKIAPA
ncbi:MAG: non-heme iron oxygenase ferredoxin subunit [Chloroflexi bacterium]|nr:non-heme iron oxygenase ferredoxin subunit [Chloroflexota bacterium]MBI4507251.1 non-heme iron oxygenase ferredoxin subunit [Chloroflexota bacterium]